MNQERQIKLFQTQEHDCSYRSGFRASTLFVDPELDVNDSIYSELNFLGFRRSGQHFYKPQCKSCDACIACRVDVRAFNPNRQQKRTLNRNSDLTQTVNTSLSNFDEHYTLYQKYIAERHHDGDMHPATLEQFEQFIMHGLENTLFIEYRKNGALLATSVIDQLADGLSAIYTYFDPSESARSPGVYTILKNVELAMQYQLPFLYLGYWIEGCNKMQYKTDYKPIELLIDGQWRALK